MPLLVEKYRPKTLDEMVGFVPTFSIDEDMPHLLLAGGAGTGKTTLAKIIIRMLNAESIVLNASAERGIDTVRDKIKTFASTQSTNSGIKVVFLDEGDHLTPDAQTALRNTMETYSRNTRFIITCNYLQRIIDPIQSRCVLIKFDNIPKSAIINRLRYICNQENIPYEEAALAKIVEYTNSDIRSAINKIEENKSGVTVAKITENTGVAKQVFNCISKNEFESARSIYLETKPEPEQFIKDLYGVIWSDSKNLEYNKKALLEIAETYKWIRQVAWPEILLEALIYKLIDIK